MSKYLHGEEQSNPVSETAAPRISKMERRRRALRMLYGDNCFACEKPMIFGDWAVEKVPHDGATIEHIIPRRMGGGNALGNLRLVHQSCNAMKIAQGGSLNRIVKTAYKEHVKLKVLPLPRQLYQALSEILSFHGALQSYSSKACDAKANMEDGRILEGIYLRDLFLVPNTVYPADGEIDAAFGEENHERAIE